MKDGNNICALPDERNDSAEYVCMMDLAMQNHRENQELIIRAVNAHDDMLAALKAIVQDNSYWWQEVGADVANQARAALEKAEGREA